MHPFEGGLPTRQTLVMASGLHHIWRGSKPALPGAMVDSAMAHQRKQQPWAAPVPGEKEGHPPQSCHYCNSAPTICVLQEGGEGTQPNCALHRGRAPDQATHSMLAGFPTVFPPPGETGAALAKWYIAGHLSM